MTPELVIVFGEYVVMPVCAAAVTVFVVWVMSK